MRLTKRQRDALHHRAETWVAAAEDYAFAYTAGTSDRQYLGRALGKAKAAYLAYLDKLTKQVEA